MPERKTGPVKPPIIEASARPGATTAAEPDVRPEAEKPRAEKPETAGTTTPERVNRRPPAPALALTIGTVVAGALVGTALTGGLLTAGLLPAPGDTTATQLTELATRLDRQQAGLADIEGRLTALTAELSSKAGSADVQKLREQVTALPAAAAGDSGLAATVDSLTQRVEALAAGGTNGADADIGALQQRLDALGAALDRQKQDGAAALAALRQQFEQANDSSTAARLPLLLVSLADDFDSGSPYAATLAGIAALQPGLAVPDTVAKNAETGLTPQPQLAAAFAAALPAMLAAAPATPDAGWQGAALDWLKGQLALRPAEDPGGDGPQALVARLEAAMARRDYRQAADLFAALPAPMRQAAGTVPDAIATHAAARELLDTLTRQVQTPVSGAGATQ